MRNTLLALLITLATLPLTAQQDFSSVEIKSHRLAANVHMLTGAGGNIGLLAGEDGVILIDDQYAPLTPKIQAAVEAIDKRPIRFVINTHWHGDHTGGNENLGKSGAVIVAHDNVRRRMSTEQFNSVFDRRTPPSPEAALPVITFAEGVTFHLNGELSEVVHFPHGHTDGDSVIYFRDANVVHTGDLFFNGLYPFIDVDSGGSIDGMIAAAEAVLRRVNGDTKIIPGHGPLATAGDYRDYLAMLKDSRATIADQVAAGKTLDEVLAAAPLQKYDARWGKGFIKTDVFTRIVYNDVGRSGTERKASRKR